MLGGRRLIATVLAALMMAAFASIFSVDARAAVVSPHPVIAIQAPSSAAAGVELCFSVVCFEGRPSVEVEVNDVAIPATVTATHDSAVFLVCVKVPGGAAGSSIVITAVSSSGAVATGTVQVH